MSGMDMAGWTWSGFVTFLVVWAVMMAAMMFPAVAPLLLMHRSMAARGGAGSAATWAFATGYLLVWTLVGATTWALAQVGVELGSRLGSAGRRRWRRSRLVRPWSPPEGFTSSRQSSGRACASVSRRSRIPDDPMATGIPRRCADGDDARTLLPGLLLGALRGACCRRRDEHRLDRWRCGIRAAAKESLLAESGPKKHPVTVLGRGSRMIRGTISVDVEREPTAAMLLDGFFPLCRHRRSPSQAPRFGLSRNWLAV